MSRPTYGPERRESGGPDDIFTWQETRRVSRSLSFNYPRKLFLLQETDVTRALAGQRVTVFELDDGTIQVRHAGKVLPMTQFGRDDANIAQGYEPSAKSGCFCNVPRQSPSP